MSTDQPTPRSRPLVAIINTARESVELLEQLLADQGIATASAFTLEFKRGERDLAAFFAEHRPEAVIFDIALPYIQNWRFFRERVIAPQYLPESQFVITTTNRMVLEVLVGPTPAIELVGRPYDLATILAAVQRALALAAE